MTQNVEQLIQDTMESYYEYVVKIEGGCNSIIDSLKANEQQTAMRGIVALSEGLVWLFDTETLLQGHSYKIDSPVAQITPLFEKLNAAIEANNFEEVTNLLELELKPLFANAKQWKFEETIS